MDVTPPIGLRIKRARERLRWSQARLADAVGVSQKTIDNWENDRRYPRSAIGALEDVLGVSLDPGQQQPPSRNVEEALDRAQRELEELRQVLREQKKGQNDEGNGASRAG